MKKSVNTPKIARCIQLVLSTILLHTMGMVTHAQSGNPPLLNIYSLQLESLADPIDAGADVYVCTVAKREPFPSDKMSAGIEQGKITLTTVKTILGKNRREIALPYCYASDVSKLPTESYVWQALGGTNTLFLCTILTNAQDNSIPTISGINEAAISVVGLQGKDDPKIQDMEAISKIYYQKKELTFKNTLVKSISDSLQAVRIFAMQEMIMNYGLTSSAEVLNILQAKAARFKDGDDDTEILNIIFYIRNHGVDQQLSSEMRLFFARCLVAILNAPSKSIRARDVNSLAFVVQGLNINPKDGPQGKLSSSERQILKAELDLELKNPTGNTVEIVKLIETWLSTYN